ncbi:M28 family metallopeptidase [Gemmatimonas phototrophica]|uniref:M28 family metallopeptidase n=1 Tax=Gemmatimonas phototrophica TaxID=1379270 RepID=UPI0005BC7FBB|nr:M28 family metallopeptidase [Gemmatimonas phototrophica]
MPRFRTALAVPLVLFAAACQSADRTADGDTTGLNTDPVPAEALAAIDTATLMQHVRVLAADSLLGRQPGTVGEERTAAYLEGQFKALGLAPGNPDGSYVQKVPLVGITVTNAPTLTFAKDGVTRSLAWRNDYVAWTKHVAPSASLDTSELVFVGYGTEAPEFQWDDFKGMDLSGKTLVMLVNDPPLADTSRFGGARMTYYGRWTYKYEQGMKHKAAGVLLIHETGPAGYPFTVVQGKTAEQFDLVAPDKNLSRAAVEGWITTEQAKALFTMAGQNFDALKAKAMTPEFEPVQLGVTASVTLKNALREVDSRNLVAKIDGSDPALRDEYVVYTAHWDHFGIGEKVKGDSIYNGAADNATGTAGLLTLAKAYMAMPTRPKRSVLFLAVTAEEQGLLGAAYYAMVPLYPLKKTVANINMDMLSLWGPTSDLTVIGLGNSELDDYAQAIAAQQKRTLRPDAEPEKGFYYRSDHFNFAKQGVPAFYAEPGIDVIGKPAGYGRSKRDEYTANDYHAPQDEIKPDWDLTGAVQDLQLFLSLGYRVGNASRFPEWRVGNEFRAARDAMLKP